MTRRPGPCPSPAAEQPTTRSGPPGSGAIPCRPAPAAIAVAGHRSAGSPTPRAWLTAAHRPVVLAASVLALTIASLLTPATPARAGIRFENCVQGSDGSISCDTVPTGNTYLDDKDAQYGLLQQASPGWSEFNPYAGYDEDFGGGED
jgi:hypothetical protein